MRTFAAFITVIESRAARGLWLAGLALPALALLLGPPVAQAQTCSPC